MTKVLPEKAYIDALLLDFERSIAKTNKRALRSIFIGGGTPSLFSPQMIGRLLNEIYKRYPVQDNLEVSMEVNPGTFNREKIAAFKSAGINRLSIGIQSFQDDKLALLQRIHTGEEARKAITIAQQAGFDNINLDLMFGLPQQRIEDALEDLMTAMQYAPTHLSWYQLTIEPETIFGAHPPILPSDDLLWEMQQSGKALLLDCGFEHYEVSGFCRPGFHCRHNLNYWEFGDYIGIGAGAHSKISLLDSKTNRLIYRREQKHALPQDYLDLEQKIVETSHIVPGQEVPLEFMLNVLRLVNGVPMSLFEKRTSMPLDVIRPQLRQAITAGFLEDSVGLLKVTSFGQQFLNECLEIFVNQCA